MAAEAMFEVPRPEAYILPPTEYVPNNPMPFLVYRNVLPRPISPESTQQFIEENGWGKIGTVWEAHPKRHFHPNAHECYAVLRGSSDVCMGLGTSDTVEGREPDDPDHSKPGLRLTLNEGDVVVHPAGTSHENVKWTDDYLYLAFFPVGAPKWRTENGVKPMDIKALREEIFAAPIPQDPVLGGSGHLKLLWQDSLQRFFEKEGLLL